MTDLDETTLARLDVLLGLWRERADEAFASHSPREGFAVEGCIDDLTALVASVRSASSRARSVA